MNATHLQDAVKHVNSGGSISGCEGQQQTTNFYRETSSLLPLVEFCLHCAKLEDIQVLTGVGNVYHITDDTWELIHRNKSPLYL